MVCVVVIVLSVVFCSGHGEMLECLEFMYASNDVIPSPVSVMLSGVVLVSLTSLLGATCC